MGEQDNNKWYRKKRFILPLSLFAILVVIGLASGYANYTVQQQPSTQTQPQTAPPQQSQPNYYINSSGNTVQSPTKTQDNSVPAGASARCRDGSYSFSQHRSGTCSHHGGVAQWLY